MPTWQSEKSKLTGSLGFSARNDAVTSAAIRHPGLVYRVRRRHRPRRMTCVSRGTINFAAGALVHTPRTTSSRRTIQRRKKISRVYALPAERWGKKKKTTRRIRPRPKQQRVAQYSKREEKTSG